MFEWFDAYVRGKPGVSTYFKEAWGWQRYFVGDKLFADVGLDEQRQAARFLTLRCDEAEAAQLFRRYGAVAPGFYTHKKLYLTIWADPAQVPERDRTPEAPPVLPTDEQIQRLIDRAYELAFSKLSRKKQNELQNASKGGSAEHE